MICFVNQVVQTECKKKPRIKSHGRRSATGLRATVRCGGKNKKTTQNGCELYLKPNLIIKPKHYKGHLKQPHSRAVSISSEYEVPSVQRKTTFLLLLLVTPQQTPVGAAAWQDRGQSIRGILLVDVHVLSGWWRFSCSLTISP